VRDEASVFVVSNHWLGQGSDPELAARERTDLAALRALPQVADAIVSVDHPLGGPALELSVTLHPERPGSSILAMVYPVDEHALDTLGVRLTSGRNFRPEEITGWGYRSGLVPRLDGAIVTQALADRLAPDGHVLGRVAVLSPTGSRVPIIGIIARLQTTPRAGNGPFAQTTILLPHLWLDPQIFYIVRAKPGQLASAMTAVRTTLYQVSRQRVIMGLQTLPQARRLSYQGDRGLAEIMGAISGILLAITAFGIFGLTSYWVAQRRRQIGIRRALGATRGSIVRYFQTENLLIAGSGTVVGIALAVITNQWMLQRIALSRLPPVYPPIGIVAMLALGQLAVLWPALRASSVPPAEATRTV
jgi:putative ABC transport system permease protein